jgi:hypothetical protein
MIFEVVTIVSRQLKICCFNGFLSFVRVIHICRAYEVLSTEGNVGVPRVDIQVFVRPIVVFDV